MRRVLAVIVTIAAVGSTASGQAPTRRAFVTCPIVRDTKTVPCWLAQDGGETYFLGIQQDIQSDFYPPQLGHQVLVEGRVAGGDRICGGIPLQPVRVSVMRELDAACQTMWPAEEGIDAPPAARGPGPAAHHNPPPAPAPPARTFAIPFDFDNDFVTLRGTGTIEHAAASAKALSATRIDIVGYRSQTKLSNGRVLIERPGLAEVRAKKIADLFGGLHVPASQLHVRWQAVTVPADGIHDAERRRVTITLVTP